MIVWLSMVRWYEAHILWHTFFSSDFILRTFDLHLFSSGTIILWCATWCGELGALENVCKTGLSQKLGQKLNKVSLLKLNWITIFTSGSVNPKRTGEGCTLLKLVPLEAIQWDNSDKVCNFLNIMTSEMSKGRCQKKRIYLGLCPKHRTPPTHRARLGLH